MTRVFVTSILLVSPVIHMSPFVSRAGAAAPPTADTVFTVLAAGEGDKVRTQTSNNGTTNSNGTEWYYTPNGGSSLGFAPGGSTIFQNSADTTDFGVGSPTGAKRLSWHTTNGNLMAGWRAGTNTDLGSEWSRYIYEANTLPSYYPEGPQTNVPEANVTGWTLCYQDTYNISGVSLTNIFNNCDGNYLMYAASYMGPQKIDIKQNGSSLLSEVGGYFDNANKVYPGSVVNLSLFESDGVTPVNWNTYRAYISNCYYSECWLDNPQNDSNPTSWDEGTVTSGTYTIPQGTEFKSIVFLAADDETGEYIPGNYVRINISKAPETHLISNCEQLFSIDTDFGRGSEYDIYKLTNDIDCSSEAGLDSLDWEFNDFGGVFDGQGFAISCLTMINDESDYLGLFGRTEGGTIKNVSLVDGVRSGDGNVGSLIGNAYQTTINNVQSSTSVYGQYNIGGIIGTGSEVTISDSSTSGNVGDESTYGEYIGGLVGQLESDSTVTRSYATGTVKGIYSIGGLIGETYESTISYSFSTGAVISDISEGSGTGGFVGRNGGSSIFESFSTGYVEGYTRVGGFAGANGGIIENAYARGMVSGTNNVGGFAGRCGGEITNAYATGFINGGSSTGGFLGSDQGCDVLNSYWDIETSIIEDSPVALGKTTDEMKQQATFDDWDFERVWSIDSNTNDGYPSLLKIGADNDVDGVTSMIEDLGPNNGDANDDGILDKYQENVTSFPNATNGKYIALETSCGNGTFNKDVTADTEDDTKKDAAYNYSEGLVSFKTQCQDIGGTATISLYFYGVMSKDGLVLRKFNPVTGTYTTIDNVTNTMLTVDGQSVLKAVYSITDGGVLDQDGIADGTITDPVGVATLVINAPNTGIARVY